MRSTWSRIGEFIARRWRWLSTQFWVWWAYFKIRAWRFWKSLWNIFSIYAVVVFLSTAVLTFWAILHDKSMPPEKLSDLNTVTSIILGWILFGAGATVFVIIFIIFTILSSFPRGRDIADNNFRFSKPTKSEKFKTEIEDNLAALEKFEGKTEKKLTVIDNKLANIEDILKSLVGNTSHAKTPSNTKRKTKKESKKGGKA